jgi:hypothetical protein
MTGESDCGAIGGMKIGRGNRSTRREPAPTPLCLPHIPLEQTRGSCRYKVGKNKKNPKNYFLKFYETTNLVTMIFIF